MNNYFSIDSYSQNSYIEIKNHIYENLKGILTSNREIIILCIGTDRCTGDALGPLVGHKLKEIMPKGDFFVYGTLENPVHAQNLENIINKIYSSFKNPYIIAIDASLGNIKDIGKVIIKSEKLSPGRALNKDLPAVGDLSITGIVNIGGNFEFLVLQNTRLYVVMSLVECIYKAIYHFSLKYQKEKHSFYDFKGI